MKKRDTKLNDKSKFFVESQFKISQKSLKVQLLYKAMIQLTNEALNHLENLTKEHNKKYVRLQVKGGGCAGFEYEWSFEDEDNREDMIIENVLLIDRMNELYLRGMHLDYKKEIWGSSFVFENPMAKSSCGCGTSFSV